MRRLAVTLVTVVLALVPAATASSTTSGLRGIVMLSPTRPVCIEGQPCSKPAAGVVLVFRHTGRAAVSVKTRSDGWYRVALAPGTYTVAAPRYRVGSGVTPPTVRAPKGRMARVDLEIDTGIR